MTLGEIVKSYRSSHAMTMAEFAERAGLSKGYISMLEKNRNPRNGAPIVPSINTYEGVAKATGIAIQELMESTRGEDVSLEPPSSPTASEKPHKADELDLTDKETHHIKLYRALDDEGRAVVDSVTETYAERARDTETSSVSTGIGKLA